jgi:tetratricopeptide (TPR) repeat protein
VALVAATRGQLREALARFADLREEMLANDNPGAAAEAAIAMARIQLVRGDTAEAVAEVERHLDAHPLQDLDPLDRPYLSLARLFADSRDLHRARHFLEAWERESPPRFRGADRWNFHRARAALHVAEGRPDSALAHLALASRALPVAASFDDASIGIHERPETARAWLLDGQPDSAIAILRRYVGLTSIDRIEIDAFELAGALVCLSELLDASGHGAAARRFFARFAELWQEADPELQSRVEAARRGDGPDTSAAGGRCWWHRRPG